MKRLNRHWYAEATETVSLKKLPDLSTSSHKGDIEKSVKMLKGIAGGVIVTNLTRPIGVPVVRVTVPGLEMFAIDKERIGDRCKKASVARAATQPKAAAPAPARKVRP
jgi:ribosomal protein S12 methylthiotransferase accessory factor